MQTRNGYFKIRHILNMLNFKRNKQFDGYKAYQQILTKSDNSSLGDKGNIIITPITGTMNHYVEGLFARKAILNGYDVYSFMCGGCLTHCERIQKMLSHKKTRCATCLAMQENFSRAFQVKPFGYSDMLNAEDVLSIDEYINSFFNNLHEHHVYLDVDVDKILYTGLQRYYLIADPSIKDDKVVRGFLRTILMTLLSMDRAVSKFNPQVVFTSHGTYSTWGSVVEYCKAHSVYVVTFGQNYNHNGIEFTYNDSYLTGDLNDKENKWMKHELTDAERSRVINFFDERQGKTTEQNVAFDYNKGNRNSFSHAELCQMFDVSESQKIIGMLPNIPWDGAVTGGSVVFPKFRDWLKFTVDFFAEHQDAVLVIRSHPAEAMQGQNAGRETTATMLAELYGKLPDNIIILPPNHKVNSYTLIENTEFCITYSTTMTLEATYMKKPVILCGCPPFKEKNIAFDITSKKEYVNLLEQGLSGNLFVDEARRERLYRYMHYFFFQRTMPQTLAEVYDTTLLKYKFSSEQELDEDPCFDYMFRCIEHQKPMDFSRFYE